MKKQIAELKEAERFLIDVLAAPTHPVYLSNEAAQLLLTALEAYQQPEELCWGCNVREPHEHRCHGTECNCDHLSCQVMQGKITSSAAAKIAREELSKRDDSDNLDAGEHDLDRAQDFLEDQLQGSYEVFNDDDGVSRIESIPSDELCVILEKYLSSERRKWQAREAELEAEISNLQQIINDLRS